MVFPRNTLWSEFSLHIAVKLSLTVSWPTIVLLISDNITKLVISENHLLLAKTTCY